MKRFEFSSPRFFAQLDRFSRNVSRSEDLHKTVAEILAAVEHRGDNAVAEAIEKFDKARLKPSQFRVGEKELQAAVKGLKAPAKKAIREAMGSVAEFARRGVPQNWKARNGHGATVGELYSPIERVGIYVPGGRVPLVSTVIMTSVLARVAKVPQIAVFTPCGPDGSVAPGILAALSLAGVKEVYRVGGVQAIGAMAFGTKTIPAVDKIFGPGNAFVVEAKRQVFGRVGIDLLPGPSEVMVIAGEEANPAFVAADLLSQAEHGPNGRIYLVAFSPAMIDQVEQQMREQAETLSHGATLTETLKSGYAGIAVKDVVGAVEVANFVAPEHLELHVSGADLKICTSKITTAGSILVGSFTPTTLGDFVAGPSHVLPTGRSGRFSSGLRVGDFFRKTSYVEYTSGSLRKALPAVQVFSDMEELDAHGRSAEIRFGEEQPRKKRK
jgi:histidinol dehydrogenase